MKFTLLLSITFILNLNFTSQINALESRGIGGGGSLFAPSISPHSSSDIYLQCDMTQVFHTSNSGEDWDNLHFTEMVSSGGMHAVEYTSNPNILYAVNQDFLSGANQLVKSLDAGVTWQNITADPTSSDVWNIFADPLSTGRLFVSSYDQLYFSSDGGNSFSSAYNQGSDFLISGVFWSGSSIFIGTNIGLLVSQDGGSTFNFDTSGGIPSGEGFLSFTGSESNGTIRLMGTTADQSDLYPGVNALDIDIYSSIISMDFGTGTWNTMTSGITSNHDLFYISSSLIDINTFYVGGTDPSTAFPVVYKTTNGGANWNEVFLTTNNQNITTGWSGYQGDENWWYGEIIFGLDVAPNDPNTVIITDYGFAHLTTDGGSSWKQTYVSSNTDNNPGSPTPQGQNYSSNGMENTSAWQIHWMNQNDMFVSFTDITGIKSNDAGDNWSFNYTGINYNTIYHIIENPSNGFLYAAVSSVHDIYQSTYLSDNRIDTGTGAILYSTDNGTTWQILHDFSMPVIWLALDPNDSNKMYASVVNSSNGGIYKTTNLSNNNSSNWSQTSTATRTEGHPYTVKVLNDGSIITSWSGHRDPGFTASSGVFYSTDEGNSWTDLSHPNMEYWTKDITIDVNDNNQDTWYVSVHSGWGGAANNKGGIYRTTDRGQNWNQINSSYRVESVTVNPINPDEIYYTTEADGLWFSDNGTLPNPTFSLVEAYNFQHPMRVIYNPFDNTEVWVTSFGNGLKVSVDSTTNSISQMNIKASKSLLKAFPNPAKQEINITGINLLKSKISIVDITGKQIDISKNITFKSNTELLINLKSFARGTYLIIVITDENKDQIKFMKF